jgi:hypothetical protein
MLILSLLTVFASHANAASVYIAKDSRTYHCDRNCPELNTDNVIEFNSPEEADVAGAIPCGHCKLTTGKLNYNVKNVLPNPVITKGSLGEFRHGTFPSPPLGEYTHVGVDLVAPCGSDVYSFADGQVKDVIDNTKDKNFDSFGYMVLVEHPASLIGKKFYTLYLHMQDSPDVKIGDQITGGSTVIGKVGDTGIAFGCHTHFEIRYFPERFSTWGNIYGPGDQRTSEYLKQNWENPLTFFKKYPNGLKLVKSTQVDSNEGVYVGDLVDGVRHGHGTITWPNNGGKYVGEFKDGKMHGQGTYIYANGDKYVGEWKDDNYHGRGTITYANGEKYVGEWKYGNRYDSSLDVSIQSFSIKGLKIGMSIQQARMLYPENFRLRPSDRYRDNNVKMEDGSNLSVDFIEPGAYTKEGMIYEIIWESNFRYSKNTNNVLMKLQKTYGKWNGIYRDKSNYYYVIWDSKFKNHTTKNGENQLFYMVRNDYSRNDYYVTDKSYLIAWLVPYDKSESKISSFKLLLRNYKIYDDAKAAEATRIKQQEALNNLELR